MMIQNDTPISALDCEIHVREMLEELQTSIVANSVEVTLRSNIRIAAYRIIYKHLNMMKDYVLKNGVYNYDYANDQYLQFEQDINRAYYYAYLKRILEAISEIRKIDDPTEVKIAVHHIKTMLMHEAGLYLSIYQTLKIAEDIRRANFLRH